MKSKKYVIIVVETYRREMEVEAPNHKVACETVRRQLESGEICLTQKDMTCTQIA